MMKTNYNDKQFSKFALMMITITSVVGLRNLTLIAFMGDQLIYFLILAAIMLLIPVAWVSAELNSIWNEKGDIYLWVKNAFNPGIAFFVAWFRWAESVILYPLLLSFFAGTVGYILSPNSSDSPYYIVFMIWFCFWGTTFLSYRNIRASTWFTIYSGMVGVLLPVVVMIVFALLWIINGYEIRLQFSLNDFFDIFQSPHHAVGLCGVFLAYTGIEIATVCIGKSSQRRQKFPAAILWACLIIVVMLIAGSLASALVIFPLQIKLVTGIMQAMQHYFSAFHLLWLTPVFGLFVMLGVAGSLFNWISSAPKALFYAAYDGSLPPRLQKENIHGAPVNLLTLQAILVSIISLVFIYMPDTNGAFWILTLVAVQLYMIVYLFFFAAAIRIRYRYADLPRSIKIPGGNWGMWLVAGIGFLSSALIIVLTFITPAGVTIINILFYEGSIIGGFLLFTIPAILIYFWRKPEWKIYAQAQALSRPFY